MNITVRNQCSDFNSYRAALVKSLFNAETGCDFALDAALPIDDDGWKIGLIVGPSGSGKTSMGRQLPGFAFFNPEDWPHDAPIVDAIAPDGDFDAVTGALASVGLGNVPAWLRPFHVLSNGEKFRANLARLICEAPARVVVDEFTSVTDRQIARVSAGAFAKAWRRTPGRAVLLSCHYDIIDWLEPDWIFDTATGQYSGRCLWRRPQIELSIWKTDWRFWPLFEPHHYLKLPKMIASDCYVGTVNGELVAHVATSPRFELGSAMRACRMVIMPEWQGAGVGMRFLNAVCEHQRRGGNRWRRRAVTYFHTSHPGLAAALRRDRKWVQCSANLYGADKEKSGASINKTTRYRGACPKTGYGGHFRAVQGFKYLGEAAPCA